MDSILGRLDPLMTSPSKQPEMLLDVDLEDEPTETTPRHLLPDYGLGEN